MIVIALMDRVEVPTPVLYLDIDGTVRQGKDDELGKFVNSPEDVHVFPEAIELMRRWKEGGGRIIGITNQGGVALGIISMADVAANLQETHNQAEQMFDRIMICPHHPDAADPNMARCWCRKPGTGLVVEAALWMSPRYDEIYPPYMSLFVGDREEDRLCAERASIDFTWAKDWRAGAHS